MSTGPALVKATFTPQRTTDHWKAVEVHFNPVSLQFAVTNTLKNQGSGNTNKQQVSKSTGKLTMELIFDTTHVGDDVRIHTAKIASYMKPDSSKSPAVVTFEWGAYSFQGMLESYKETIDFFSPSGVPLRASCNITLASQEGVFAKGSEEFFATSMAFPASDRSPTQIAADAGDPNAGRAIAAGNGSESTRTAGNDSVIVDDSISLGSPVAFASGGAGAGLGAGIGIGGGVGGGIGIGAGAGISAGAGIGASAGLGATAVIGASAGAGVSLGAGASLSVSAGAGFSASAGGSASAGVSASSSGFAAGLHTSGTTTRLSASFSAERLLPHVDAAQVATDSGATFQVGGQATVQGAAGVRAEVGASTSFRSALEFD